MLNRLLGGLGRTLIFAGVVLLLFVGYQLWGTKLDEESHQEDLTRSWGHSLGLDAMLFFDSAIYDTHATLLLDADGGFDESAVIGKQAAQPGEIAADARGMQLLNHAFCNDAFRHCSLSFGQASAARISPPICSNAVRAYGITAPRP